MVCEVSVNSCAPYANVDDVRSLFNTVFDTCITSVPNGTATGNFIEVGFGDDGPGECCGYYVVEVLGADPEVDPSVFYLSTNGEDWYQFTESVDSCTVELPAGTLESNYLTAGWGGSAPTGCDILSVQYDDQSNMWISPDAGTTWYPLWDDYTETTNTLQSGSTTSATYVTVGTSLSLTAEKDHIYLTMYAQIDQTGADSAGSSDGGVVQVTITIDSVTYMQFEQSLDQNANSLPVSIFPSGRIPCVIGDTIDVDVEVKRTGDSHTVNWEWRATTYV